MERLRTLAAPVLLACALALLAGLAAGCGGGGSDAAERRLFPPGRAENIKNQVDDARDAAEAGDCEGAADALQAAQTQRANLPDSVSASLNRNLGDWLAHLEQEAATECEANTETTTTDTETTAPPPVQTQPPDQTQQPPAQTQPPPAQTQPPPARTQPPDNGGGSGSGGDSQSGGAAAPGGN